MKDLCPVFGTGAMMSECNYTSSESQRLNDEA